MNVLLTGGAGYIGSHLVRAIKRAGHQCFVLDNLSNGHAAAAREANQLIVADLADRAVVEKCLRECRIDSVIHLAAFIEAGESVARPDKYFQNNTIIGLSLLEAMRAVGVKNMVFSSTAAVYGNPQHVPIEETDYLSPISPYGASKLCVEFMIRGYAEAFGMGFVALRYFNVAGAHPDGDIGEAHNPETHLLPIILGVAQGKRKGVTINGDDYDTPDGTCIRDYIHVCDLADAHLLALAAIEHGKAKAYNLGNGEGFSNNQVIETCRQVTGHRIPHDVGPRRAGDPARLVASSTKAMTELGWQPKYPYIKEIVYHAWQWHKNHPNGYA